MIKCQVRTEYGARDMAIRLCEIAAVRARSPHECEILVAGTWVIVMSPFEEVAPKWHAHWSKA
jgi:hypothetical protein